MPANWTILQSQLATWFDNNQTQKTEQDTARLIANSYYNSILSSNIVSVPGSVLIPASPDIIANGFQDTLRILKRKSTAPTPGDYLPAAIGVVQFWAASKWSPAVPPIGFVSPTLGYQITSGGSPAPLNYNIWNAFNNKIPGKVGAVISTKLVSALSAHLFTVQGVYNGLVPSPTGLIPGPPFPWLGVA